MTSNTKLENRKTTEEHKKETGHFCFNSINETEVECLNCDAVLILVEDF